MKAATAWSFGSSGPQVWHGLRSVAYPIRPAAPAAQPHLLFGEPPLRPLLDDLRLPAPPGRSAQRGAVGRGPAQQVAGSTAGGAGSAAGGSAAGRKDGAAPASDRAARAAFLSRCVGEWGESHSAYGSSSGAVVVGQ
jgi:hypothetical protein